MEKGIKCMNISFGYTCNNNCVHCIIGYDKRKKVADRSSVEIKEIMLAAKEKNAEQVTFIGGEVMIRPDLFELLGFARDNGLKVHIESNGRAFSDKGFTEKTMRAIPDLDVAMSFHHTDPKIQDKITQVKGSFSQSVEGIKNLKGCGLKHLTVIPVISRLNYENLPELTEFLKKLHVDEIDFTLMRIGGNAQKNRDSLLVSIEEIQPYLFSALGTKGINVRTYGFPYCTIGGFEGHAYEINFINTFLEEKTYIFKEHDASIDWQRERLLLKHKLKKCRGCRYFNICEGIWKEYIALFGSSILHPVKGKKLTTIDDTRLEVTRWMHG